MSRPDLFRPIVGWARAWRTAERTGDAVAAALNLERVRATIDALEASAHKPTPSPTRARRRRGRPLQ